MSFIRTKEIPPGSGNLYKYEVESYREDGHVRQRVLHYMGSAGHTAASGVKTKTEMLGTTAENKSPRSKQPWEMTREEFDNTFWFHGVKPSGKYFNSTSLRLEGGITRDYATAQVYAGKLPDTAEHIGDPRYVQPETGGKVYLVKQSDLHPVAQKHIKPQMTTIGDIRKKVESWEYDDNRRVIPDTELVGKHTGIVIPAGESDPRLYLIKTALKEGVKVPPEVLKDYPDLALGTTR
jgi:hypothetical protein